jgi:pimeloyl-ACP methyl ester carboxylesterase
MTFAAVPVACAAPDGTRLELLAAGPSNPAAPPLLLLHGAFGGAWMWAEHTLPWFAGHGRQVYALSFRGHGDSEGHEKLQSAGLADYVADTLAALRCIARPAVVLGHSLGALVAQRLLARPDTHGRLRALGLLAPVPAEGMAGSSALLALADPPLFGALALAGSGLRRTSLNEARRALFSADLPEATLRAYHDRLGPESALALAEAQFPSMLPSASWLDVPALVLLAESDRLIAADAAQRTALWHGARCLSVPGPHLFMLDAAWPRATAAIWRWLAEIGR